MPVHRSVLFAAALVLAACGSGAKKSAPEGMRRLNVVLVTLDTLRADRLGPRTPNLDRLARRGVLFENAVAQAPLTSPSHASMMTGQYPTTHKVRDTGGFVLAPSDHTLAAILQRQGWDTAAFVGSSVLKRRFGFNHGFAVYDDEMKENAERRAGEVVDRAVAWLERQSGKPFFLWVHVYDPHLPYSPPAPFPQTYDGEVAYMDQQLGRLFDAVERKPDTLVAALSDHGESFSEHGEYAHGVFLYDTTLRIPFIMAGPGVPAGRRVRQQARTIDLLPTLLELMAAKAPGAVEGISLAPAFAGKEDAAAWSYLETLFPKLNMGWAELRGIRTPRWKYIRAPRPELYDLARDPGETTNVIAAHANEARELEAKLAGVTGGGAEKVQPAQVDQRTLAQLKSLGYLGGGSQREYALTGQGTDPKDRTEVLRLLHFGVYSGQPAARRMAMLREAVAKDPANPALYSNLGDLYAAAGRNAEAMKLYQDALKSGIRAAWLFSRMGNLCLRQGKKNDAVPLFEAAAQINPYDYESLQNLAVAYRETGKIADAEAVLRAIIDSGEPFAPALNEMGMVAYQKGDKAAAQGYFEKAAQLDPAYQLNLARLYKMTGDKARARAAFEAFLAAKGGSAEYRQVIPQVREELAAVQ